MRLLGGTAPACSWGWQQALALYVAHCLQLQPCGELAGSALPVQHYAAGSPCADSWLSFEVLCVGKRLGLATHAAHELVSVSGAALSSSACYTPGR